MQRITFVNNSFLSKESLRGIKTIPDAGLYSVTPAMKNTVCNKPFSYAAPV